MVIALDLDEPSDSSNRNRHTTLSPHYGLVKPLRSGRFTSRIGTWMTRIASVPVVLEHRGDVPGDL